MDTTESERERQHLLAGHERNGYTAHAERARQESKRRTVRTVVWSAVTALFIVGIALVFMLENRREDWPWSGKLPKDPVLAAKNILKHSPVIDGHIDLPLQVRLKFSNNVSAVDLQGRMPGDTDIPRLREGQVGGFFWSIYVRCETPGYDEGKDFVDPTWRVRDTLEQIDVAMLLINKYPDTFQFAASTDDIRAAIANGKIASLFGIEGGHQLGNSLGVLRQYYALGIRYITLTHWCHNAFGDSSGLEPPGLPPLHGGLTKLGYTLVEEMNRLGVMVDVSHVSDATAMQAIKHSKAPVIWSHSSARAVHNVPRNVPDEILKLIGTGEGQKDGVVMVNFAAIFIAPDGQADVSAVADHVDHIAKVAGKEHVGLGSDFDGIPEAPKGLEDVSKFPALIAELYSRGWDRYELSGLTGGNLLRVFEGVERVSRELKASGAIPSNELYDKRPDLPMREIFDL